MDIRETTSGLLERIGMRSPVRTPVVLPEDYRALGEVNKICTALEASINRGDADDRDLHEAELKKEVKRIGEQLHGRIADAPAQLETALRPYVEALHTSGRSDQELKDDLLETVHLLIHRGKASENLTLSQLLDQLNARENIIRALDVEGDRLDRSNRRQKKGILAIGLLALLTSAAALSFRGSKAELQIEVGKKTEEIAHVRSEIALALGENETIKRQLEDQAPSRAREQELSGQIAQLTGVKSDLEARLGNRERELIQKDELLRQRDEQIRIFQTAAQVHSADEVRAREFREKAKKGQHLTPDQVEIIRRASEQMIARWRGEAEGRIELLMADLRRRTAAGENTSDLSIQIQSQRSITEQQLNSRIVQETQERDSLIVQGQQARP